MAFSVGQTVIHQGSGEKGVVLEVHPEIRGRQLYTVSINNEPKKLLGSSLLPDLDLADPFKRLRHGLMGSYLDFCRINTSFKIKNTSNNTISSLKASNTIFKPYQFKPLLKFLNSDNRRLLIADEVGLGKTIAAGHIMMELAARRELRNCLIICPKSLAHKWQCELKEKFNFSFVIYETSEQLIQDIKERGSSIKGIINYEKINFNNEQSSNRSKKNIFDHIVEQGTMFDLSIFDEAHRLRNHTSQRHKGASILAQHSRGVVFLTATPIMIDESNLFNLLSILDDNKYTEYATFANELEVNKPFIRALNQLNSDTPFARIKEDLESAVVTLEHSSGGKHFTVWHQESQIKELFANIPLFNKIIYQLESPDPDIHSKVQLQFDLSDMSAMNNIFSRTRKKEVTQDWTQAIREPQTHIIDIDANESRLYDEVVEEYRTTKSTIGANGDLVLEPGATLGLIQVQRQLSSSIYAYLNTESNLENGIDVFEGQRDSKFERLLEIIREVVFTRKKKLIIFTTFKKTIKYLSARLGRLSIGTAMIHGGTDERHLVIAGFKQSKKINILLSTEVGSEGLDMQFCDALVNYDLPWNPMVVEQRIGRIDRFGQESQILNIYNLVINGSIQEEIYVRLLDRIGIFRTCIGDIEAILDKELDHVGHSGKRSLRQHFADLEQALYCTEMTNEQLEARCSEIELAVIAEKKNLDIINEGLTDTLTNDVYFKDEIAAIEKNGRYVTERELVSFVETLLKDKLTTCDLEVIHEADMIYKLKIPLSMPRVLINFLLEYEPESEDAQHACRRFIHSIRDRTELVITFSQDTAYNDRSLIRINAYHPIIIAAEAYFSKRGEKHCNTFQFSLCVDDFKDIDVHAGDYILGVYSSTYTKRILGRDQVNEQLLPVVYDVIGRRTVQDRKFCDKFFAGAQGSAGGMKKPFQIDDGLISDVEYDFTVEIEHIETEKLADQSMRLETFKQLQLQRRGEFFNNKVAMHDQIVGTYEELLGGYLDKKERINITRALQLERSKRANQLESMEAALRQLNDCNLRAHTPQVVSLNLISVY